MLRDIVLQFDGLTVHPVYNMATKNVGTMV